MLLAELWVIMSFVSDPGISCLLVASMKMQQTNLLVQKWGKTLHSS